MAALAFGIALLAWAVAAKQSIPAKVTIPDTVHAVVGPWIEKEKPPGVIVVVRHNGRTPFFPFGEADKAQHKAVTPDSIFELASIAKVFTTTSLVMNRGKCMATAVGRKLLLALAGKPYPGGDDAAEEDQ